MSQTMPREDFPSAPRPKPPFPFLTFGELGAAARHQTAWLWGGYVAAGAVTLLTSQWKSGKTTLISVLLDRLGRGGTLAGRAVRPARAVVLSEEGPEQWLRRGQKLAFGDHVEFLCRPFRGQPHRYHWLQMIDLLARWHAQQAGGGPALLVVDPLGGLLPAHAEASAGGMLEALSPLQKLTAAGLAVLLAHHPRKAGGGPGQAARGTGALPAFADVLIEMSCYRRPSPDDRRRRLQAFSRFDETPRQLVIELTADGTDYAALGDFGVEEFADNWEKVRAVLAGAGHALTRRELLAAWPGDFGPLDAATLWRWLDEAYERGLVGRAGTGRRNSPHRYWLPGRPEPARQESPDAGPAPE